jgi:hemin uptake protein HemP
MAQTIKLKRSATQNSIPTTSALALGEVAINTYDGKMYIKKSVGGTETVVEVGGGGAVSSSFTVYEYTATANQTTFSGSDGNSNTLAYDTDTPPKILVYLNGVLLDFTTDYTASNGTSVVLTSAAVANDLVQIAAYKSSVSTSLDISLSDSQKLLLGNDDDLEIFHDGSHSRIKDTGTGNLILNTQAFRVNGADDSEGMIKATQDGNVELYYNGLKKIETTTQGAIVTGTNGNVTIGAQNTSGFHIYTDRPRFYFNKRLSLIENILTSYDNNLQLQTQGVTKLTLNSAGINVTGSVTASGGSVLARPVLVNGAHDNSGNANFAVDGGSYLTFYDNQVQIGNSSQNWNLKISHDMSSTANMQAWNSNIVIGSNGSNTGSATARDIIFSPQISGTAASTERMRIKGDGNVGIGTANPGRKLTVQAATGDNLPARFIGGANTTHGSIEFQDPTTTADYKVQIGSKGDDLYLQTGGGEKVRIKATGNVGIGTTTPQSKLDVNLGNNETASIGGTISAGTYAGLRFGYSEAGNTNYRHSAIVFERDDASFGDARGNIHILNSPSGSTSADLGDARLTILPSGNIGIGTTSPSSVLHVKGGSTTTQSTFSNFISNSTFRSVVNHANEYGLYMGYSNATTDTSAIQSGRSNGTVDKLALNPYGGNVGIGTNNPIEKLHVKTSATGIIARLEGETGRHIYTGTDGSGHYIEQVGTSTANRRLRLQASNGSGTYTQLNIEGGNRRIWTNSGTNVGIGTSSPQTNMALDVRADGNTAGSTAIAAYGYNATGRAILANGYATSGTGTNRGIEGISTGPRSSVSGSINVGGHFYAQGAETNYALTTGTGNVGIGETTPTHKLHVAGDIRIDNGSALKLYNAAGNGWAQIAYNNTLDHIEIQRSFQSSTDSYYNLGSSAKKWLSVYSDTIKASNGTPAAPTYTFDSDQNTGMYVDSTADTLRFSTGGVQRMYLNNAGITSAANIYSGTTSEFRNYGGTWKATTGTAAGDFEFRGNTGGTNTGLMYMDTSTGRVAVGNGFNSTNVKSALQVDHAGIDTYAVNTSATSAAQVDTFPAADFRSARFTVQITNTTDSTYQITEILLIHDGTTPSMTEYGTIFTGSAAEATFDADIVSGNIRLLATPASTDSMAFKVVRYSILV